MPLSTLRNRRGPAAVAVAGALLTTAGLAGLGPSTATASSHREAPLISGLPQYDNTDTYAFRSPDAPDTVTLIANWIPFEEPAGGPNFYPWATDARYDIHIDNNHDAKADITFRWTFKDKIRNDQTFLSANGPVTSLDDENLNYSQTYKLVRITKGKKTTMVRGGKVAPSNIGEATMPDYQALRDEAVIAAGNGAKSFVGQAEDSFFLDLRVFDLLYGGDLSETGDDTLAGFNVNSVALQVPQDLVAKKGDPEKNPIVGIWSTTSKKNVGKGYTQVSRLGMPLVNEVVLPLAVKDAFNGSNPTQDVAALDYVTDPELPKLIEAVYGIEAPATPREDLVSVFLTGVDGLNKPAGKMTPSEQIRLNMSIPVTEDPDRLGVLAGDNQGFPNGRRLGDDVIDIALQVVEGELVGNPNDLGDGVDANDAEFSDTFPYLALPASGSNEDPHPTVNGNGGLPLPSGDNGGGIAGLFQNDAVAGSALGVGALALLVGSAGMVRRRKVVTA